MAKQQFNFYMQHDENTKRTRLLNIMLPGVIVLVLFIITLFLGYFNTEDDESYGTGLSRLMSYPSYWKWMIGIFIVWYLTVLIWAHHILKEPIKAVMEASYAEKVKPYMEHWDPKVKMYDDVVGELAIAYGMKKPDIYLVSATIEPNAFAVGNPEHSAVAITQPLLDMLDRDEISGVMGHELAHIAAEDSKTTLSFALFVAGLGFMTLLGLVFMRYSWVGSGNNRNSYLIGSAMVMVGLIIAVAGAIGKLFANLLKFAMSRTREYDADAMSAKVNQSADGLISSLTKIDKWVQDYQDGKFQDNLGIETKDLSDRYANLYFVSAKTHLFDDHPSTKDRIDRLKEI